MGMLEEEGNTPHIRKRNGGRRPGGRRFLMCCDAPVADLFLPPLIYPDWSLCVILR